MRPTAKPCMAPGQKADYLLSNRAARPRGGVRGATRIVATVAILVLLAACAPAQLARGDRYRICTVAVVGGFEAAAFRPNPLANPIGGPVGGATAGAVVGMQGGTGAIVAVPIFAAIGAIGGAACGAGALIHPDADAKFQAILASADTHRLTAALSTAANSYRTGCAPGVSPAVAAGNADAIVEIKTLEVGMGCPYGNQSLLALVRWRVVDGRDGHELATAKTRCSYSSTLEFGEWFADASRARAEIERLLTNTGARIAEQMFSPKVLTECTVATDPSDASGWSSTR